MKTAFAVLALAATILAPSFAFASVSADAAAPTVSLAYAGDRAAPAHDARNMDKTTGAAASDRDEGRAPTRTVVMPARDGGQRWDGNDNAG